MPEEGQGKLKVAWAIRRRGEFCLEKGKEDIKMNSLSSKRKKEVKGGRREILIKELKFWERFFCIK